MNLLFFIFYSIKDCSRIRETPIGSKQYTITTEDDDTLCIKPLYYPTYIVFSQYNNDTVYYGSIDEDGSAEESSQLRFLPFYQIIDKYNYTAMIKTPTGGNISFSSISFPGSCADGVYFSTKLQDEIILSQNDSGFKKLQIFDDKCMIWSTKGHLNISLEMESDDNEDQLYIYYNYTEFSSISGNSSLHISTDATKPVFFRLVADDFNPPRWAKIKIRSDGDEPRRAEYGFYIPKFIPPICDDSRRWFSERTAILSLVCLAILMLLTMIMIGKQCIFTESEQDLYLSAAENLSSHYHYGTLSVESLASSE